MLYSFGMTDLLVLLIFIIQYMYLQIYYIKTLYVDEPWWVQPEPLIFRSKGQSHWLVVTKHKTSHLIGIYWGTSDFDKLYVPDLTMMSCTCHDTHFGSKGHGDGSQWPVLIFLIRFLRSRTHIEMWAQPA